mgnify:CR=1 FL=1
MSELKKIIDAYTSTDFKVQKAALATVIKVTGSSYRGPGARMYITDDGKWVGCISGGCLEGDALRKSRKVMNEGVPQMVTYDTTEENNSLGVGLGCEGIIHVLLEPVTLESDIMRHLGWVNSRGNITAIATVFEVSGSEGEIKVSDHWLLDGKNTSLNSLKLDIEENLNEVVASHKSFIKHHEIPHGTIGVFYELFEPPVKLLIFGGGFDAQPVVALATQLGWRVSVVDECVAHLLPLNFPQAELVSCKRDSIVTDVSIEPYSAAVLMSHSYAYDYSVLKSLIATQINYVGILGPKKKGDKMMQQLLKEGVNFTSEITNRIHYPIGLDIGADTPEEIAVSIIAEIKAKFSGRTGRFLKQRKTSIHDKKGELGEISKQSYHRQIVN